MLLGNTKLVIVHNDFHQTHGLFTLFNGLVVKDLYKPLEGESSTVIGRSDDRPLNGHAA